MIYMVTHVHDFPDGHEDLKIIGFFSTQELADQAVAARRDKPGFRDHPEGFSVDPVDVDKHAGWEEGYVSV